jgi:2-iminobutanoate/2-iminopropanoate deaminase
MSKKTIRHPNRRVSTGAYSDAIQVGPWVFVSGCDALDLSTKQIVGTTIEEQTKVALANVEAILGAAGLGMEHVVKCTAYLKRIEDFGRYNAVYERAFPDPKPARTTLEADVGEGLLVEIDAVAYRD